VSNQLQPLRLCSAYGDIICLPAYAESDPGGDEGVQVWM